MARKLRLEYRGAIYHVTVRSNGRAKLFEDDKDRLYLLGRLEEAGERHGVRLYLCGSGSPIKSPFGLTTHCSIHKG